MFCKCYKAPTAIVKLSSCFSSQVVLYWKEWVASEILPIKWKPPRPTHDELYGRGIMAELGHFCALRGHQFCFWLSSDERGSSPLVLLRDGACVKPTAWSVWVTASPSELQLQTVYPNYKWKRTSCFHCSSSLTACYILLLSMYGKKRCTKRAA